MKKKLLEIMAQIEKKHSEAVTLMGEGELEKAEALMNDVDKLNQEYTLTERLFKSEPKPSAAEIEKGAIGEDDVNGFAIVAKMMSRKPLLEVEKAALVAVTDPTAPHGENYILPQEINLKLKDLRKNFKSAKTLVSVTPVSALSGRDTYTPDTIGELVNFTDGEEISEATIGKFTPLEWTVKFYGNLIPISNILLGAEENQIMSFLRRFFLRSAVATENKKIFEAANTCTALKGDIDEIAKVRKAFTTELDPDMLVDSIIVTNQTGFGFMEAETDAIGRPMLIQNPTDPSKYTYAGYPVHVFSNGQLPDKTAGVKAPIFLGSFAAGIEFKDYEAALFAMSEHFGFNKNQTYLRVMEAFDVKVIDKTAILVGTIITPKTKVVITEAKTAA